MWRFVLLGDTLQNITPTVLDESQAWILLRRYCLDLLRVFGRRIKSVEFEGSSCYKWIVYSQVTTVQPGSVDNIVGQI